MPQLLRPNTPLMPKLILTCLGLVITFSLFSQQLISHQYKGSFTKEQLIAEYGVFMQNGVDMYKITYTTPDIFGVQDTASGLVIVPIRDIAYAYPLLCYQHGTVNSKTDVPSNLSGGYELGLALAGLGYVVSAADYLGLGESRGFHPYVHAETEASAAIDMLFAVRELTSAIDFYLNDQLFITGYSQGGHAAMAAHRKIQQDYSADFTVTAAAPMSGPYSISTAMKALILSTDAYYFPAYIPFTVLSYNLEYQLLDDIEQYFKQPYATVINQFYDGNFGLSTLNNLLISQLESIEGSSVAGAMLQDSILQALANDPQHPANIALEDNDVYDWTPEAPTRLYYCTADDQVPYTNSIIADSVMNMNGAPDVESLDVNPAADHGGCVEPATTSTLLFFGAYQDLELVSIDPSIADFPIKIYPNPANDLLQIDNLPARAVIEILDFTGRTVLPYLSVNDQSSLNLQPLDPGVYLLRITANGSSWTGKVVKE